MKDFLDTADQLYEGTPLDEDCKNHFKRVLDARESLRTVVNSKSKLVVDNIEMLFGAIEMGCLIEKFCDMQPEEIFKLKESTIYLIKKTIEASIKFAREDGRITPPGPYGDFAEIISNLRYKRTNQEISIITFNYDYCMDYALHIRDIQPNYFIEDELSSNQKILTLLKLHGSLTWGQCSECKKIIALDFKQYKIKSYINNELKCEYSKALSALSHCGRQIDPIPFIIPPTWNKSDYHTPIAKLWGQAAKELSEANNIFVIGYSYPETDMFFKFLYALGSISQTSLKRFWVFDPDEIVKKRYSDLIGGGISERFKHFNTTFSDSLSEIRKALSLN